MIIGGAALVAVAAAVLLLGGGKDKAAGGPAGGPRGGAMSANVPVVKAVNPTRGDIRLTSGLTGTVEPADVVYVYAKASGDVTAVMVKAGDTVTAGQVLCEIDLPAEQTAAVVHQHRFRPPEMQPVERQRFSVKHHIHRSLVRQIHSSELIVMELSVFPVAAVGQQTSAAGSDQKCRYPVPARLKSPVL